MHRIENKDNSYYNIGCYTSKNLINWTRQNDAIIRNLNFNWETTDCSSPCIVKIEHKSEYKFAMLYEGRGKNNGITGCVCIAYSNDLLNWNKDQNNPIIIGTNGRDKFNLGKIYNKFNDFETIVPDDIKFEKGNYIATFHIYNVGKFRENLILKSTDLLNWNKIEQYSNNDIDIGQGIMFYEDKYVCIDKSKTKILLFSS